MVQQLVKPTTDHRPCFPTYERFLAWATDHPHAEWIEGEVVEFMTVKLRHDLVSGFLFSLLKTFVDHRQLGHIFRDPYAMLLLAGRVSLQPDVGFVLSTHRHRFTENHLQGPADLVIEVISQESVRHDRRRKFDLYARAGVPEYWLAEGRAGYTGLELYVLSRAGAYERIMPDARGRLISTIVSDFWLTEPWLAADPLPEVDDVLDEIWPGIHEERAERARQRRAARAVNGT
jgi:Uma2 family endonuclease